MRILRFTAILVLLIGLAVVNGCSEEAPLAPTTTDTGGGAALKGAGTVEFHAKVRNTIQVLPPFPPPTLNAIFEGEGKSRPFGPFTLYATSQVDVTVYPANQVTEFTLTFRNGDQLFAYSAGTSTEDPPGTTQFQGEFTWTGGTGIFANVTGSGTYGGTADVVAGVGNWGMDGVIAGFGGPGN
jgi:hypothetical protein